MKNKTIGIIGGCGIGKPALDELALKRAIETASSLPIVAVPPPKEEEQPRGIILKKIEREKKLTIPIQNFIPPKTRAERRKEERKNKKK